VNEQRVKYSKVHANNERPFIFRALAASLPFNASFRTVWSAKSVAKYQHNSVIHNLLRKIIKIDVTH
jgi:hypothetical protein